MKVLNKNGLPYSIRVLFARWCGSFTDLKCPYDQIFDDPFFFLHFVHTVGLLWISCQTSTYVQD